MRRNVLLLLVVALGILSACEAETSLELTPEVVEGGVCPRPHDTVSGPAADEDWGTVTPVQDGIEFTINAGYTATLCAKGGPSHNIITLTGPQSGFLQTPPNQGGNIPDLSHWSVTDVSGGGTSTSSEATTTSEDTTTTIPADTTTTTIGEDTTTTIDEVTTLTEGQVTTTEAGATTTDAGATTTTAVGEVTTTAEVGGGTLDPGQETTTTGEGGATTTVEIGGEDVTTTADEGVVDPGQVTSTTGDEVAGESTLPYTGNGDISATGLAVVLLVSGAVILLLARRRPESD